MSIQHLKYQHGLLTLHALPHAGRKGSHRDRLVSAVVEALAPDIPALTRGDLYEVRRDVSRYLGGQMDRMPPMLGVPVQVALELLNLLAVYRYARPFLFLDQRRRRAWLDRWSDADTAPARELISLLRGHVLLAWYDHRLVAGAMQFSKGVAHGQQRAA